MNAIVLNIGQSSGNIFQVTCARFVADMRERTVTATDDNQVTVTYENVVALSVGQ